MKYSTGELRDQIALEERRAARKIKKIAAGTYNPRGKRSRLYDITQANRAARGEIPMPRGGLPVAYYRGVDISGTERDPRRDSGRLREPGLKKYLEDLKTFNSGLVNYFKAADGSVVTGQEIRSGLSINGYQTDKRMGRASRRTPNIGVPTVRSALNRALDSNLGVQIPWVGDESSPTGGRTLGEILKDKDWSVEGHHGTNESVRPLNSNGLRERRNRYLKQVKNNQPALFQQDIVGQFYSLPKRVHDALLAMDPVKFLVAWEAGGEFADALADLYREALSNPEDEGLTAAEKRAMNMIDVANQLDVK